MENNLAVQQEEAGLYDRVLVYAIPAQILIASSRKAEPEVLDGRFKRTQGHLNGAFEAAASALAAKLAAMDGTPKPELAFRLCEVLSRCQYDVFSRKKPREEKALKSRNLVFRVRLNREDVLEPDILSPSGTIEMPVIGRNIVLPYHHNLEAFCFPASAQTFIAVDLKEKKIWVHGRGAKDVRELLAAPKEDRRLVINAEAALIRENHLLRTIGREFPQAVNLREKRRLEGLLLNNGVGRPRQRKTSGSDCDMA